MSVASLTHLKGGRGRGVGGGTHGLLIKEENVLERGTRCSARGRTRQGGRAIDSGDGLHNRKERT